MVKAFTKSLVFTTLELPLKGCAAYLALSGLRASLMRRIKVVPRIYTSFFKDVFYFKGGRYDEKNVKWN